MHTIISETIRFTKLNRKGTDTKYTLIYCNGTSSFFFHPAEVQPKICR